MDTITQGFKTRQVASQLGINPHALLACIARGKIAAPAKDCSGDFIWTEQDIAAARAALATDRRRREFRQPAATAMSAAPAEV